MKKQIYEDDLQKEGFVKVASNDQFESIISEFDAYYGANKLNEIENVNETALDLTIKKRKQFANRNKSKETFHSHHNHEAEAPDKATETKNNKKLGKQDKFHVIQKYAH